VLYNQPLEIIQKYIQGRWKFIYAKGGFSPNDMFYCDSCFEVFTSDNRHLFQFNDRPYYDNNTITWRRGIGHYTNGDSTWLMEYHGASYVIQQIYYDTLIYNENMLECSFHHLIRSN
jgi:hypothetical protein